METRHKIEPSFTTFDKVLKNAGIIVFLALWGLVLFALFTLPLIVPVHYAASGKPDNHGNKIVLLCLPVLATLLFWLLSHAGRYPGILRHLETFAGENPESGARQIRLANRMLSCLKLVIALFFFAIVLFNYLTIQGKSHGPEPWILLFVPVFVVIPAAGYIYESLKKRKIPEATEEKGLADR